MKYRNIDIVIPGQRTETERKQISHCSCYHLNDSKQFTHYKKVKS